MREVANSGRTKARSSAVSTAITPGAARAAAQSVLTMRACACSLRRNATCSASGALRSSTNVPRPVSRRGSSVRLTLWPTIFGRAMSAASFIGVGALAQRAPLRVVMAAQDGGAARPDVPDFLPRLQQRVGVPGVARRDVAVERRAQRDGVGREQERAVAVERHQRAHRSARMAGQGDQHDPAVAEYVALAVELIERQADVPFAR